jgi:UDP-N-acetylglucosamine acyltransferase
LAIVEEGAQLGTDCVVHPYAIIKSHAVLGDAVEVHPFAVIGGDPQYLKFASETKSAVRVGSGTIVREHVTINRSIYSARSTVVGERCFLMANAHVGHDCAVGDDVVIANNVMLAGHVSIGSHTFLGGAVAVHQFVRIGEGAMISGVARCAQDVPPYSMAAERNEIIGLNLVGIKRRNFGGEVVRELKKAFRTVYFTAGNIRELASAALADGEYRTAEAKRFLAFFTEGKRGFARARRGGDPDTEGH